MKIKVRKVIPRRIKRRRVAVAAATIGLTAVAVGAGVWGCRNIKFRPSSGVGAVALMRGAGGNRELMLTDFPAHGVGRADALDTYTEGDGPAPAWWNPDEAMSVEWSAISDNFSDNSVVRNSVTVDEMQEVASYQQVEESNNEAGFDDLATYKLATKQVNQQVNPIPTQTDALQRTDVGCPDWNLDSTLRGWDGRSMEVWEMDVFSRIFYLEYWGSSDVLCEAGCDAILRMWELDGGTMYETLSHVNENGSYTYSTFPGMWDEVYDPEGLAWCRAYCEERFAYGPEWSAPYFQKFGWPDWGEWSPIPAYEIDGIYFSVPRG